LYAVSSSIICNWLKRQGLSVGRRPMGPQGDCAVPRLQ